MNNLLLKNQTINEADAIASRRGFLTRMAYGSLLAMGGSGIVQAATKHITHAPAAKKSEAKKTVSGVKSAVHERLALKTEHNRHGSDRHEDNRHASKSSHDHHYDDNRHASRSAHEHDYGRHHHELASNEHSRIHTSLDRDHDGGYRLHHEERERLAFESNPSTHQSLRREMPEFATQAEMELD